jgi:EmrB/QacA subfamily drug resistance transporter
MNPNVKWFGFSAILVGMSASSMMQTMVATSLPVIAGSLGGMNLYSWVFGGYMLASTITIPLFARLADLLGRKTLYIFGLSIFLAGSALIAIAQSMGLLVAFRILQGIGAGAVAPAALASIGDLFPDSERGRMFGIIGIVQVLSLMIGPPLGGWITDIYSWRLGFFLVLPVGLLAGFLAWRWLPDKNNFNGWRGFQLDWQGAFLIGLGLCLVLLGVQNLGAGFYFLGIFISLVAILLLRTAYHWEKRCNNPLIPISMLKTPYIWKPTLGTILLGFATNGAIAYLPLYLQNIFSYSAAKSGFALLPMLFTGGLASGMGGLLANRFPRQTQIAAWILVIFGFSILAVYQIDRIFFIIFLIGIGLGLLLPVYLLSAQKTGGETHLATSSGLIQMGRNMGGAIGIPLLGVWLLMGEGNIYTFAAIFASLAFVGMLGFSLGFGSILEKAQPV